MLDIVNALAAYSDEIEGVDIARHVRAAEAGFIIPAIERRRAAGADGSVAIIDGLINHRTTGGRPRAGR